MNSGLDPSVTELRRWQEEAIGKAVDSLYSHHPSLVQAFGPRGRQACCDDIRHHLEHLDIARATGETSVFTNYATWLKEVLDSRGVPSSHLAESFELLAEFLAEHLPAAESERLGMLVVAANEALRHNDRPAWYVHPRIPALTDAMRYRKAALSGRQALAQKLMSGAMHEAGLTLSEASVRLIQPAMVEVGQLWQENRISTAQEHMATAISQNVMARAYLQATFAPRIGRTAIFACIAGNHHSLGLRMVSDAFETVGWDVLYLGANVPITDLVRQVDGGGADLLSLSLSLPSQIAVTRETIERLRAELGSRCPPIWIGGMATQIGDRIWRSLKADGWAADALHAQEEAKR